MKAICHREGLLAACQLASAAVATKDLKAGVYKNFKAVAGDGCILMAHDTELGIRIKVHGLEVEEAGEAILPAAKLLAILRESVADRLEIEADPSSCRVTTDTGHWEMPSEDPAHFNNLPAFNEERYHEIQAGPLREMIRRTVFAAATDATKYSTTGVLWEAEGDKVRLVATDHRRMALTEGAATAHGSHTTKGQAPIVPAKTMSLLERNLQDDEEMVRVALHQNDVMFGTDRAVIYSRLVEGRFPPWRDVLTFKKTPTKVQVLAGPFQAALRQAAIMSDDEARKVMFQFAKGKLTLEAHGSTSGRSKVSFPLEYEGKNFNISLNSAYVIDMLRVLPEETALTLELIDANSPVLLRTDDGYTYMIAPLQT
jgi:DNA polymerase-3 subunit beta